MTYLNLASDGWLSLENGIEFLIQCALFSLTQETGWRITYNRDHIKDKSDGDLHITVSIQKFQSGLIDPSKMIDQYTYNHYRIEVSGNVYSYQSVYRATITALTHDPNFAHHYKDKMDGL